MNAAARIVEALAELGLPSGQRERMAHIILDVVGYNDLRKERDDLLELVTKYANMGHWSAKEYLRNRQ